MSVLSQQLRTHTRLNTWLQRAWALAGGVSVRTKILGIVLAMTTLLGIGITLQVRLVTTRTFIGELENRGNSVVRDLAARSVDPLLLNDLFGLHELLVETVENHPDVRYAFIEDATGQVLAHTFDQGFPVGLLDLNRPASDGSSQHLLYLSNEGRIHDFAAPLLSGQVGVVHVGLSETRLQRVIDAITGQMLLTTVLVALVGIATASLLTWLLTRPILDLVETTRRVGQGDMEAHAPRWANDEIGALADAFNQMLADLRLSRQAIAEKDAARGRLLAQLIDAQEEERKRIARELHDGVGQSLTSLLVRIRLIDQANDPAAVHAGMDQLRQITGGILEDVRLLSRQLRPSVLDDLGLVAALERYIAEFSSRYPEISVDFHCNLAERLSTVAETALYRVVQEAMTNTARHSSASSISVLLTRRGNQAQAIVEDNGQGFDPEAARRAGRSVGIHGMAERAELLGGRLDIESSPEGTTVYVEVPL